MDPNSSSNTTIDDILARSLRLEAPSDFRVPMSVKNISSSSRNILSKFDTDSSKQHGQLLLSQQKVDSSKFDQTIKSIDPSHIVQNEKLSFSEFCRDSFHDAVVKSILATVHNDNTSYDDFFFDGLLKEMKRKELSLHRTLSQHVPASLPIYESKSPDVKMVLSQSAQFYYNCILTNEFAKNIARDVRKNDQNIFTMEVQQTLSDTFNIIHIMSEAKSTLQGAIRYLERQARKAITNEVNMNLPNANRGGKIGIIPTVQAFIKLNKFKFGNSPWAVLFFTIRVGAFQDAIQYLNENQHLFPIELLQSLKMYANHTRLTNNLATALEEVLSREATMVSCDFFKAATLSVITGKLILPENDIIRTVEDWIWMWLQFTKKPDSLIENKNLMIPDRMNPFKQGQIFLLSGLFENAAKWFLSCDENIDDCLHIVIAMMDLHLINCDLVLESLLLYAKDLFKADPIAAVRYLSLIENQEKKILSIAKLAVDAQHGEQIFEYSENGGLSPISQVLIPEEQHKVIIKAAEIAEYYDQHGKAASFYSLAGDYNKVIDLECIELTQCIEGFLGEEIINHSISLYQSMINNGVSIEWNRLEPMKILIHFAKSSAYLRNGQFQNATEEIENARLFPSERSDIDQFRESILSKPELQKAIPATLVNAMKAYTELYKMLPPSSIARLQEKKKGEAILDLTSEIDVPEAIQKEILDLYLEFQ